MTLPESSIDLRPPSAFVRCSRYEPVRARASRNFYIFSLVAQEGSGEPELLTASELDRRRQVLVEDGSANSVKPRRC
jgi:hypothetical protein